MDSTRFDDVARALSPLLSRRGLAGLLGLAALGTAGVAEAKKKRKKRRKKKNKNKNDQPTPVVKLNQFGCVNVGDFCESAAQCCSGICTNAACQAHDVANCQAGNSDLFCSEVADIACAVPGGGTGECLTTTGNAGFCGSDRQCVACKKDVDCQSESVCRAGAACVVCPGCVDTGGTACVASGAAGCT